MSPFFRFLLLCTLTAIVPVVAPAEPSADAATATAATCVSDATRFSPALRAQYTDQAWATRNELFLRACQESNGAFVDVTDPTLAKRLVRPTGPTADNVESHYPPELKRAGTTGWVDLIMVAEVDGSVTQITPAQGAKPFLDAAFEVAKTMKYKRPAALDGKPTRCLLYIRIAFN